MDGSIGVNNMEIIRSQEHKFKNYIGNVIYNNIKKLPKTLFQINQSNDVEDNTLSFDLIFNLNVQISVRLRKNKYIKYKDITIRSRSKKGYTTEIDKIYSGCSESGCSQIYFYGWLSEDENEIIQWILLDINKFRKKVYDYGVERKNDDGTEFKAFSFKFLLENNAIIDKYRKKFSI